AFVEGPTLTVRKEPGDDEEKLTLTATRRGDLIAAAAGIGAQLADKNAVTVAGSVGVNLITDDTEAYLRAVNTKRVFGPNEFDVEGATSLNAADTSSILSIGGGFAITLSPLISHSDLTLTLGVSGAGNVIGNTVKAFIEDSALKSEGDVELTAQSAPTISAFTFAGALTAQGFGHGGGGVVGTGAAARPP